MRDIKFRAWDEKKKMMIEFGLFDTDEGYLVSEGKGVSGLEIMQYTGLKDKNGKEIYEGDIVKANYRESVNIVEWVEKHAAFSIGGVYSQRPVNAGETDWEVIGNIFENPELLASR